MSITHDLHKIIGGELKKAMIATNRIDDLRLDPACDGSQNIPLFIGSSKSNATECCNADVLITKDDKIKLILEIEEANNKPTQICGKFLTSVISDTHIHIKTDNKPHIFHEEAVFVQVVDTSKLKHEKSSKMSQFKIIEDQLKELLPLRNIRSYRLFPINGAADTNNIAQLVEYIMTKA